MGTNLYQEAIAEARQLRDMAEQNAKNKIIDAVTPKIRALIERELLSEEDMEVDDQDVDSLDSLPMQPPAGDAEGIGDTPMEPAPEQMTLDLDAMAAVGSEIQDTMDTMVGDSQPSVNVPAGSGMDVEIDADGSVKIDTGSVDLHVGETSEAEDDDILLSRQMAEALTSLLRNERKASTKLKRIQRLEANVRRLSRLFERLNVNNLQPSHQVAIRSTYTKMLREAFSLYNDAILTEGESDKFGLRRQARSILKEMKQMAYNKKDLFSVLNLFEAEEKEEEKKELDEVDAELTLEPADDAEAEELEALLGDLDLELSIEDPEGEEGAEEMGAEDLGGEEEAAEEMPLESDGISVDVAVSDDDEIVEISETMLRRELQRMRRQRIREAEGVDAAVLDNFGDGDDDGDSFVDVDEDALLNALADELGDAPSPEAGGRPAGGDAMPESFRRRRARRARNSRVNESRKNRALTHQLTEYKKAVGSLRTQLTEMNLFNAKLLYANKLMQNRNVTPKQQRAIVEGLDKAKTLREAKLLYQSLTASLNKGTAKNRSLTESRALRGGSSSKSTRPAGAKSGVEADRWAVLAGLNNNK